MFHRRIATGRTPQVAAVAAGLALLVCPALVLARDDAAQQIPITDAALLERLGFAPGATNVFATPQALQQLLMTPAERALAEQARLEEQNAAHGSFPAGGPYGVDSNGFASVWGKKFVPNGTATEYNWDSDLGRYCLSGPTNFHAQFEDVPHGAKVQLLDLWYFDASDEALEATMFEQCQGAGGTPITNVLGSHTSSTQAGHTATFVDIGDRTIDTSFCIYYVRVRLDDTNGGSCSEGADLAITKAALLWRRQISPAPATATFNDVPTSHQFFQHIEALAASGITGGCDSDSFCPNAPLTRGQMAVFLSKALGLHW